MTERTAPPGLEQIYYYITFNCNLRCSHCYVGGNLTSQPPARYELIATTLHRCHQSGARKVTFLGGEPTLHPDYARILTAAAEVGYRRIIVDTNGVAQYPLPEKMSALDTLAVRFGLEGVSAVVHDKIRGNGTFRRALKTLRRVVASGVRVEVTFTLNAHNISDVSRMVAFCADEGVSEVNFHFMSLMGNGKARPSLGLAPERVLRVQGQLELLKRQRLIPMRYPRLLVREEELATEVIKGCACRIFRPDTLLIFPEGETCRCPLEITPGLARRPQIRAEDVSCFSGCPLSWRLFPGGVPSGYVMTCISWKGH